MGDVIQIFEHETPMFAEGDEAEEGSDSAAYDLLFLHDGLLQNAEMPAAMIVDEGNEGEADGVDVKQESEADPDIDIA